MKARIVLSGRNEYDSSSQVSCEDIDLKLNKRGNYFHKFDKKLCPSFVPFFSHINRHTFVFNKLGVCVSHLPSKKYFCHKVNAELLNIHDNN